MNGTADAYVGPDRRQRLPRTVHGLNRRLLVSIAAAVLIYGVTIPTVIAEVLGAGRAVQASVVATIVCAILFAQGGLLFLLRWRLTGDGRTCLLGVTALVFGFFVAPLAEVFTLLGAAAPGQAALESVAQGLVGIVAAAVATRSVFSPPVDSRLRPGRILAAAVAGLVLLCTATFVGYRVLPAHSHHILTVAVTVLAGVGWLGAGSAVLWRGRSGRLAMSDLLSAPLLVLGLGSIAGGLAVYQPVPFTLDASALDMAAALLLAGGAAYSLLATLSDQGTSALRLRSMLKNLEQYRAQEEERVHDARSALLAVQTAITALTRYRERLDDQSRTNLELAVDSELARLVGLMGKTASAVEPTAGTEAGPEVFDAVEPVGMVATAATAVGVRTRLDAPPQGCPALGKRDDVARVVETLLGNARRYAPGSPVAIRVRSDQHHVTITVSDRGPGIAPGEHDVVFARGGRGSTSAGIPGSGLGLHAARRLMEGQDGSLVLERSELGGATFVATLPVANPAGSVPRRAPAPAQVPAGPPVPSRTARPVPSAAQRARWGSARAASAARATDPSEVA